MRNIGLAAIYDVDISVMDIRTAFLGCNLYETIDVRLPEGFRDMNPKARMRPVLRLQKTIYGSKLASREHFEEVHDFVVDPTRLGLAVSLAAPGLFFGPGIILLRYVDEIMLATKGRRLLDKLRTALLDRFKANGPEPSDTFPYIGMRVTRNGKDQTISIDQIG